MKTICYALSETRDAILSSLMANSLQILQKNVLSSVSLCSFSSGKHIIIEVPIFVNEVAGDRYVSLSG